MYFAISPKFSKEQMELSPKDAYGVHLAQKYNVPLLNHLFIPEFSNKSSMFADRIHLNDHGAKIYTRLIIDEIKQ